MAEYKKQPQKIYTQRKQFVPKYHIPPIELQDDKFGEFISVIVEGNKGRINNFIMENNFVINMIDENGECILHHIIKKEQINKREKLKIIKFLINKGAPIMAPDKNNMTPLHLACKYQLYDIVRFLLSNNCDPNVQDNKNMTPMHYAIQGKSIECHRTRNEKLIKLNNPIDIETKQMTSNIIDDFKKKSYQILHFIGNIIKKTANVYKKEFAEIIDKMNNEIAIINKNNKINENTKKIEIMQKSIDAFNMIKKIIEKRTSSQIKFDQNNKNGVFSGFDNAEMFVKIYNKKITDDNKKNKTEIIIDIGKIKNIVQDNLKSVDRINRTINNLIQLDENFCQNYIATSGSTTTLIDPYISNVTNMHKFHDIINEPDGNMNFLSLDHGLFIINLDDKYNPSINGIRICRVSKDKINKVNCKQYPLTLDNGSRLVGPNVGALTDVYINNHLQNPKFVTYTNSHLFIESIRYYLLFLLGNIMSITRNSELINDEENFGFDILMSQININLINCELLLTHITNYDDSNKSRIIMLTKLIKNIENHYAHDNNPYCYIISYFQDELTTIASEITSINSNILLIQELLIGLTKKMNSIINNKNILNAINIYKQIHNALINNINNYSPQFFMNKPFRLMNNLPISVDEFKKNISFEDNNLTPKMVNKIITAIYNYLFTKIDNENNYTMWINKPIGSTLIFDYYNFMNGRVQPSKHSYIDNSFKGNKNGFLIPKNNSGMTINDNNVAIINNIEISNTKIIYGNNVIKYDDLNNCDIFTNAIQYILLIIKHYLIEIKLADNDINRNVDAIGNKIKSSMVKQINTNINNIPKIIIGKIIDNILETYIKNHVANVSYKFIHENINNIYTDYIPHDINLRINDSNFTFDLEKSIHDYISYVIPIDETILFGENVIEYDEKDENENVYYDYAFNKKNENKQCFMNDDNIIELLIEKGADINLLDVTGSPPLIYAIDTQNINVINILKKYNVKISNETVENNAGLTPLDYVISTINDHCEILCPENTFDVEQISLELYDNIKMSFDKDINTNILSTIKLIGPMTVIMLNDYLINKTMEYNNGWKKQDLINLMNFLGNLHISVPIFLLKENMYEDNIFIDKMNTIIKEIGEIENKIKELENSIKEYDLSNPVEKNKKEKCDEELIKLNNEKLTKINNFIESSNSIAKNKRIFGDVSILPLLNTGDLYNKFVEKKYDLTHLNTYITTWRSFINDKNNLDYILHPSVVSKIKNIINAKNINNNQLGIILKWENMISGLIKNYFELPNSEYNEETNYVLYDVIKLLIHIVKYTLFYPFYAIIVKTINKFAMNTFSQNNIDKKNIDRKVAEFTNYVLTGKKTYGISKLAEYLIHEIPEKIVKNVLKLQENEIDPDIDEQYDKLYDKITDIIMFNPVASFDGIDSNGIEKLIKDIQENEIPYFKKMAHLVINEIKNFVDNYLAYIMKENNMLAILSDLLS